MTARLYNFPTSREPYTPPAPCDCEVCRMALSVVPVEDEDSGMAAIIAVFAAILVPAGVVWLAVWVFG